MLKHVFCIAFALIITATVPALAGVRLPDTAPIPAERPFVAPDMPDVYALQDIFLDKLGCHFDDGSVLMCPTARGGHTKGILPADAMITVSEMAETKVPAATKTSTTTPILCGKVQWDTPLPITSSFHQSCVVDGIRYDIKVDLQVGWEI